MIHPKIYDYLNQRGYSLLDFQKKVIETFQNSDHGLIKAPTGRGKTLALFFAICNDLLISKPKKIIWVTPMRALVSDTYQQLERAKASIVPSLKIMQRTSDTTAYQKSKIKNQTKNAEIFDFKNFDTLELKNISFGYKKNEKVLKDINIKIKKGDFIGIKGESGSGKTTLIDIILGLQQPESGEIKINGKSNISLKKGYVPQNSSILDIPIRDNVAFGIKREDQDFEQIIKSLEKKPEALNLLTIYSELTQNNLEKVISELAGKEYSVLKTKLSDVLISEITPIGKEIKKLLDNKSHLKNILKKGSEKANIIAEENLKNIREKVGLI